MSERFKERDWCGFRRATECHIFTCRCGCGGHVAVKQLDVAKALTGRQKAEQRYERDKARHGEGKMLWGKGFYIEEHAPAGVHESRTGERVALRPTS